LVDLGKERAKDAFVQGGVAIAAGVIIFTALFLPWLSTRYTAISGLTRAEDQASVAIPMTLILVSVLTVFGGTIHILGYSVGIQVATLTSAVAFFISAMVIIATLALASSFEGKTLDLLVGPWIGAAGSIFGVISSKLEHR
jgi:hypothetical protein